MAHDVIEEIRTSGEELVIRVREILREGNVRRLVIKNHQDETLLELPLTYGVIGVGGAFALAPVLSSIAVFAFFAKDARILVQRYTIEESRHFINEMKNKESSGRNSLKKNSDQDPYELDAGFEILDP